MTDHGICEGQTGCDCLSVALRVCREMEAAGARPDRALDAAVTVYCAHHPEAPRLAAYALITDRLEDPASLN